MNTGAWLVLSGAYSVLLLIVQRAERKRRNVTLIILAVVGFIVGRYGIYRMESECLSIFPLVCRAGWILQEQMNIAYNTLNLSLVTALIFNLFFWVLIGRSNPPGASDSIKVFGMDDFEEPAKP